MALDFFFDSVEEFFAITLRLISFSYTFVVFFMNVVREFFIEVGLHEDTVVFDDFLDVVETLFADTMRRGQHSRHFQVRLHERRLRVFTEVPVKNLSQRLTPSGNVSRKSSRSR